MMKIILMAMLGLPLIACANVASDSAICDGLAQPMTAHAAALAVDGGPQSIKTGDRAIRIFDAGCGK